MKEKLVMLCAALCLMFGLNTRASADDLGCQVILCFGASAIGGWQNVAECVPPVKKALRKMLRGSWKPRCSDAGDADKGEGTFLREGREDYEDCAVSHGEGWIAGISQVDNEEFEEDTFAYSRPRRTAIPVCVNTATSEEAPRQRNPSPDYFDVFIDGTRVDRVFWDEKEAAAESEVPTVE